MTETIGPGSLLGARCPECGNALELGHDCLAGTSQSKCDECGCFLEDCRCGEYYDDRDEFDCTICGGDGTCMDNTDPLWDCDDMPHACHACGGTGRRSDQRYF